MEDQPGPQACRRHQRQPVGGADDTYALHVRTHHVSGFDVHFDRLSRRGVLRDDRGAVGEDSASRAAVLTLESSGSPSLGISGRKCRERSWETFSASRPRNFLRCWALLPQHFSDGQDVASRSGSST
jgi:hypothetical protein